MTKSLRQWTCLALLACLTSLAGCNQLAYWMYLITPEPTETIEAQFADLNGHTVAVVVYADEAIQYNYPSAPREVSAQVSAELQDRLTDVTTVDPIKIHKYQQQNIQWDTMSKTELGKMFGADYVLYITLIDFSTREQGSVHLFRGRINAECAIYEVDEPEYAARGWDASGISVLYPPDNPYASQLNDDYRVRLNTIGLFARKLVENFYEHEATKSS